MNIGTYIPTLSSISHCSVCTYVCTYRDTLGTVPTSSTLLAHMYPHPTLPPFSPSVTGLALDQGWTRIMPESGVAFLGVGMVLPPPYFEAAKEAATVRRQYGDSAYGQSYVRYSVYPTMCHMACGMCHMAYDIPQKMICGTCCLQAGKDVPRSLLPPLPTHRTECQYVRTFGDMQGDNPSPG